MENYQSPILVYLCFIWFVILHTFEEISKLEFGAKIGPIKNTLKKYLILASIISTVNLGTLFLIVSGNIIGLYVGIFTSIIFGVLQAPIHAVGHFRGGIGAKAFSAGLYSSIPLSIAGAVLLFNILQVV